MVNLIYLAQHGKAFDERVDPERNLTPEGVRETELVASYLRNIGISVSEVIHSGKRRALQTAEIFARYFGVSEVRQVDYINPNDDPAILLSRLGEFKDGALIVGHLPHLSRFLSLLILGKPDVQLVNFRYSGVLRLRSVESKWGIDWYITPDVVR